MRNRWLSGFLDLLFPRLCVVCGSALSYSEEYVCVSCLARLPKTRYHLLPDNNLEKCFWGKINIEHASAFFYYTKGSGFDKILHELKYRGMKELGQVMGRYMATEIISSGFFDGIDVIVPVPLHPDKKKQRGYNQSEWIAAGLSAVTGIPVDTTSMKRKVANPTQTHKNTLERWENVQGIFEATDVSALEGKHVLLVDDVLTTGSTILSCASALDGIKEVRFSILTLAAV